MFKTHRVLIDETVYETETPEYQLDWRIGQGDRCVSLNPNRWAWVSSNGVDRRFISSRGDHYLTEETEV